MYKAPTLLNLNYSESDLFENHISGLMYGKLGESSFKRTWKEQWFKNELLLKEILLIGEELSNLNLNSRPTLVKGVALLYSIYKDFGSRFMSDSDILLDPLDLQIVRDYLIRRNYKVIHSKSWFANDFKIQMNKIIDGVEVNIELHSKLLFHHDYTKWNKIKLNEFYDTLTVEDHFIYLSAHLAFSHSFLKLFWSFDLYFLNLEGPELSFENLKIRAKELNVLNSLKMSFWVLNNFFSNTIKSSGKSIIYRHLFTESVIWKVRQSGFRYFLIKHLSKDSLYLSFKYDVFWALNKLFGK
jgi:hypothetical protein